MKMAEIKIDDAETGGYADEPIAPRQRERAGALPPLLAEARNLEWSDQWQSRADVFLKQGKLLADYEDDFFFNLDPARYFPTYQSLANDELRGYFTWRAKVRRGDFAPVPLTFIFLYAYEIINMIGFADPLEAYARLGEVRAHYRSLAWNVETHLSRWLNDFVIYYNLDSELLRDSEQVALGRAVNVIERARSESADKVMDAVKVLAPKWLGRSRFYAERFEDMDKIIHGVLVRMANHYDKGCARDLAAQFFGARAPRHVHMFGQAVFCDPLKRDNYEYAVDEQTVYKCEYGHWTASRRAITEYGFRKLEKLLKTIDSVAREEYAYPHAIQTETTTRWLLKAIREEVREFLAAKAKAAEKAKKRVKFDFSRLDKIRADAAITMDRLIVEEEEEAPEPIKIATPPPATVEPELTKVEKRYLLCLLRGEDTNWTRAEGFMESVLADAINEKLFERFQDNVLDAGSPVEDYADELKEMLAR